MKIVFATANRGKLREASEILGEGFEVLSPADLGIDGDVEENGSTLKENSQIKARHIHALTKLPCFADDTGLEVDALGGAPGIYSARYAGEAHDSEANMSKLLSELGKLGPSAERSARFRTVITLIMNGEEHFFEGTVEGSIARERSGKGGFGYDPVFFLPQLRKTYAQLTPEEKAAVSHRGKALEVFDQKLRAYLAEKK